MMVTGVAVFELVFFGTTDFSIGLKPKTLKVKDGREIN